MIRLKELDQEIIKVINKLVAPRWTDIKRNLPQQTLDNYNDKSIDVYISRSLKRLQNRGYIYKTEASHKGQRYHLNPAGMLLAYKIKQGIRVDDPIRDQVLAFGHALQWLKNRAIIDAKTDTMEDYFTCFKEAVNELDVKEFVSNVDLFEDMLRDEEDPWDDSDFVAIRGNGDN